MYFAKYLYTYFMIMCVYRYVLNKNIFNILFGKIIDISFLWGLLLVACWYLLLGKIHPVQSSPGPWVLGVSWYCSLPGLSYNLWWVQVAVSESGFQYEGTVPLAVHGSLALCFCTRSHRLFACLLHSVLHTLNSQICPYATFSFCNIQWVAPEFRGLTTLERRNGGNMITLYKILNWIMLTKEVYLKLKLKR